MRGAFLSTLTSYLTSISSIGMDLKKNLRLQNISFGFPERVGKFIEEELREFKFDFSAKGYLASLSALREAYQGPLAWLFVTAAARLSDSHSTNAVLYGQRHEVYIPTGLLSQPVFYGEGPPAYNYGTAGHVVATELLGLLDTYRYSTSTILRNRLQTITQCLIEQEKQDDGDACDAGKEGRSAWMLDEVDWDRDRDFDLVRALKRNVDRAFERDHPLFVSGVAGTSVVDDNEGTSSVDFINSCRSL
ncbi:hypothetical protein MRX96_016751 [Rhipicephalus microplus]